MAGDSGVASKLLKLLQHTPHWETIGFKHCLKLPKENTDEQISNWTNFSLQNLTLVCKLKHLKTYLSSFNFVTLKRGGNGLF